MNSSLLIRLWGNSKIYKGVDQRYFEESKVSSDAITDGFIKRFMFGKPIVVYKDQNKWIMNIDGLINPLDEVDDVAVSVFGVFVKLTVVIDGRSHIFIEICFMESITRIIDPTYDYLDSMGIFGFWLLDKFKK